MVSTFLLLLVKYIFFPIIIGIVSTVCYVLLFDKLLKNVILPWYFSRKYKSTLIDGIWEGKTDNFIFYLTLEQTGDKVQGEMSVSSIHIENTGIKEHGKNRYSFEGEIKDGFVRITHKEKDRNSFGFGCFLFQILGGGKILNGGCVYVSEGDDIYTVATEKNIKLSRKVS